MSLGAPPFGLLPVRLCVWAGLPLDLAVGLLLGLHTAADAQTVADLAGWWLR